VTALHEGNLAIGDADLLRKFELGDVLLGASHPKSVFHVPEYSALYSGIQQEFFRNSCMGLSLPVRCPDVASKLGANLKRLRKAKSLTQQQVAENIGLSQPAQVSQWEGGRRAPNPENLRRLATFFAVPVAELDPDGEAWDAERPRAERLAKKDHIPPSQTHVAAPPPSPTGAVMGSGEPALFEQVEGAWKLLRSDEERRAFVEHVRGFVHLSTAPEATRKKATR
jgi:transcriptional regulator with XRE-family HTH domain